MLRNLVFLCVGFFILSGCVPGQNGQWTPQSSRSPSQAPSSQSTPAVSGQDVLHPTNEQPMRMAKVALLVPMSGRGSDTGFAMLNAAQLAMNDLNAAEAFELMPRDTGSGAATAAHDALQDGASLILGPVFSDDAKAVAPLAVGRGVAVVSFSTDTTAATGTTFLMGFVPQSQVEQILDYSAAKGLRRIALIAPRDVYGDAIASSFYTHMQRRSLPNSGIVRYNPSDLPSAQQISEMKKLPFDAVLIATSGLKAAQISALLDTQGLSSQTVKRLGTGLWDDQSATSRPELQGAWYAASSPDLRIRFERRYRETYGATPPRLASLAYDATALAVVLSKTGAGYGRSALTNPNGFAGIDGIFRFRPDGLADRGLAILEIRGKSSTVIQSAPSSFSSARK